MGQGIAGGARRTWVVGAALVALAALPVHAQGTGNGYLFGVPSGGLTVRAGWFIANASSGFVNVELSGTAQSTWNAHMPSWSFASVGSSTGET